MEAAAGAALWAGGGFADADQGTGCEGGGGVVFGAEMWEPDFMPCTPIPWTKDQGIGEIGEKQDE